MLGSDVAGQPGAAGQHLRVEPGVGQMRRDELGGRELLATQFGVRVDVPTPSDQVVVVRGQPALGVVVQAHDAALTGVQVEHAVTFCGTSRPG